MFKKIENLFPRSFLTLFNSQQREELARLVIEEKIPRVEFKIKLKNKELFIFTSHPGARSELFLQKKEILEELEKYSGYSVAKSITIQKF